MRNGLVIKVGLLEVALLSTKAEESIVYRELRPAACRSDYFARSLLDLCKQEKISWKNVAELLSVPLVHIPETQKG